MPLTTEVLILAFTISGITLKLADIYGERGRGYVFAAVSAAFMGIIISDSPISSSIILGIIIGVALARKIDQPNLIFGLGLTLATAIIFGFNFPDLPLLATVSVAALIDEVGHDKITSRDILEKFFRFRMALKAAMVILTILRWIDIVYAIGFFCFDISYDLTHIIFRKRLGKT